MKKCRILFFLCHCSVFFVVVVETSSIMSIYLIQYILVHVINGGMRFIFKYWKRFGMCCQRVQGAFSVQSRDAYKFMEINPSSLSEEERNQQYVSITEKLKKINPDLPALCDTQE